MAKNKPAFAPVQEGDFEHSIFISLDFSDSVLLKNYAEGIQRIMAATAKVKLNDLSKLHSTLVNNLIGDNTLDVSRKAIEEIYNEHKQALDAIKPFEVEVYGPHLMANFGVVLGVKDYSGEVLKFRRSVQEIKQRPFSQA